MKIVLAGAPGSGKTKLAKAIAKELDGTSTIVDGYVEKIAKATDKEYSIYATYGQNLQAAAMRMTAEQTAEVKGAEYLIVCGSIVESLVYNGLRTNRDLFHHKDDEDLQKILLSLGEGASMGLGVLVTTGLDPTELILYLPLSEATLKEYGKSYEVALDKMIPEALQSLNRPYMPLAGSTKQKAKDAIKLINEYKQYLSEGEAEQPTLAQGSGTGTSGEPDPGKRTGSDPLPDLQESPA